MRSNWLLLAHLLAAFALVGGLLAVSAALRAGADELLRGLARRTLIAVAWPSLVVVVATGEALKAQEDAAGRWLDVSYVLFYLVGVLGTAAVTITLRRLPRVAAAVAPLTVLGLLAVAFLMAAKP